MRDRRRNLDHVKPDLQDGMLFHHARVPIYVLTVDGDDGQRKMHCSTVFRGLDLSPIFVHGFLWDDLPSEKLYSPWKNIVFAKRSLSDPEIAVYLGHRKIWAQIAAGQSKVALVVEDDFAIIDENKFLHVLANASHSGPWEILKLFDFAPKKIVASHEWHGMTLVDYKYPAAGCVAYLITRDAARRMLRRQRFYRPVDEDISWCWEFDLRVRSLSPNIVAEISHTLGGSLIEDRRSALRQRKNPFRSFVGMILAVIKQVRARRHLDRIRANCVAWPPQSPE
jgi:GR25 family glycosyltransferase involved in LPS biosynthesis